MESEFHHKLEDKVSLRLSGEQGIVVGRAEYNNGVRNYQVRYLAGDGCQRESWFEADAIEAA